MIDYSTSKMLRKMSGQKNSTIPTSSTAILPNESHQVPQLKPPVAEYDNALRYILGPTLSEDLTPMDK
jgi:hypothetical protein